MFFQTTSDLKKVLPFTGNFEFDDFKPFIERAEREFLIPFIGKDQYDELNDAYNAVGATEDTIFPALKTLLIYAREPVAHGAFLLWIPFGNVNIGKSGFSVTETEQTKIVSQFRIEDLKSASLKGYFSGIESMLVMMEKDYTSYPEWTASDEFSLYKEGFVNTALDFQEYVDINLSRMIFTKVKPNMKRLEIEAIQSITGVALFNEIKAEILDLDVSVANKKLLPYIKRCLCNLTIGESLRMRTVSWTDYGLQMISTSSSLTQVNESAMDLQRTEAIRNEFMSIGKKAMMDLRTFLYANVADYPLFEADTTVYQPTVNINIENKQSRTTYFV